jgi:hypothetical protein
MESWLAIIASGVVSGLGAYMAIRIEIALIKHRMDRSEQDRLEYRAEMRERVDKAHDRADAAHDRIDGLQRSRMDTL